MYVCDNFKEPLQSGSTNSTDPFQLHNLRLCFHVVLHWSTGHIMIFYEFRSC